MEPIFFIAPWVLLALLSTFADAGVGYIDEWLLTKIRDADKKKVVDAPGRLILISGFFGVVVSICVALYVLTTNTVADLFIAHTGMLYALGAGVLEVVWLIPYFYALQRGGALNATPLFQAIPIFSLIFGIFFFNEVPIALHIAAAVLILAGAALLNYSKETRRIDVYTLLLMLVSSAIISMGYFLFKDATMYGNFAASLFYNGLGMGIMSTVVWVAWPPYRAQFHSFITTLHPKILFAQLANEGLYALAAIMNQLAIVLGPSVMIVSTLGALHPVFTFIIGWSLAHCGSRTHKDSLQSSGLVLKTIAILLIALGTVGITLNW